MKTRKVLVVAVCLAIVLSITLAGDRNPAAGSVAEYTSQNTPHGDLTAVNNPDMFAWQVLAQICQNAPAQTQVRSGSQSLATNNVIWETWADDGDTFPQSGKISQPPQWPGGQARPKLLRQPAQQVVFNQLLQQSRATQAQLLGGRAGKPASGPPMESLVTEEVRRNLDTFNYIVQNNLWYTEGQEAAFNKGVSIGFPTTAIEVKADWVPINTSQKPSYHWNYDSSGNLVGLVALHIITKDLPNWFWATFEWVGNDGRCDYIGCQDSFGVTPANVSPVTPVGGKYAPGTLTPALLTLLSKNNIAMEWQNYRLKGTQIDFTDSTGRPTHLGNSVTEHGFVPTASCITCHAKATVNGAGQRLTVFLPNTSPVQGSLGTPDPGWFFSNSNPPTMLYLQLDFVWGFALASSAN
jgi:hypothetical protein